MKLLLPLLLGLGLASSLLAAPAQDEELSGVLSGYSTRYATVTVDGNVYRIDRNLLRSLREQLKTGAIVRYQLDFSAPEFPDGVVTQLRVLGKNDSHCPPFCL